MKYFLLCVSGILFLGMSSSSFSQSSKRSTWLQGAKSSNRTLEKKVNSVEASHKKLKADLLYTYSKLKKRLDELEGKSETSQRSSSHQSSFSSELKKKLFKLERRLDELDQKIDSKPKLTKEQKKRKKALLAKLATVRTKESSIDKAVKGGLDPALVKDAKRKLKEERSVIEAELLKIKPISEKDKKEQKLLARIQRLEKEISAKKFKVVFEKKKKCNTRKKRAKSSMKVGLGAQLQIDATWKDGGDDYAHTNLFRFRRLQPLMKGHLLDKRLTYKLMFETGSGVFELMDLFVNYKLPHKLQVRAGVQKVPFTRLRLNSWKTQHMIDFSIAPRYLGTERQLGIVLHRGMKSPKHEAAIGIWAGVPTRTGCGVGITKISKVDRPNPSDITDQDKLNELHPAISARYAYNHNGIDTTTDTDWKRSGLRASVGAALYYDFRPVSLRDFRAKTGVEAMLKAHGFSAFGTFWTGFYQDSSEEKSHFGMWGAELSLGYLATRWMEVAFRASYIATSLDLRLHSLDNDPEMKEPLKSDQEYVWGLGFYPFGKKFKLATDFGVLHKTYAVKDSTTDYRVRWSIQFFL